MPNLVGAAIQKFQQDGLLPLIRSALAMILSQWSKFHARILAGVVVYLLKSSGRVIQAEEISQWSCQYVAGSDITVSVNGGTLHPELSDQLGEWTAPPQMVRILNDIRLVGPYGLVVSGDGKLVIDECCNSDHIFRWSIENMIKKSGPLQTLWLLLKGFTGIRVRPRESTYDYAVSMLNPHASNYFHWTAEHVPRLRSISAVDALQAEDVELIIESTAPAFVDESLSLLGYTDYFEWEGGVTNIKALVVPDHRLRSRNDQYVISPSDLRWLRDEATTAVEATNTGSSDEYVYISREDAETRRVSDESELLRMLDRFGFEKYVLSKMSLSRQIQLFSEAELILAPHGAGLANMIYADRTEVIELYGEDITQGRYYLILANELGHPYYTLTCATEGQDLLVPIDELAELIDSLRDQE